jgi:hypothetical protein|tara:strand:+ start:420 stop:902 length:483 start_codon:yes stop_codon:yes gene_type:complete
MNKKEAIRAMLDGHKVKLYHWGTNSSYTVKWILYDNGGFWDNLIDPFLMPRADEEGWEIYSELPNHDKTQATGKLKYIRSVKDGFEATITLEPTPKKPKKEKWILWQKDCGKKKPKEGTYKDVEYWSNASAKWCNSDGKLECWGVEPKLISFYRYKKVSK